MSVRLFYRVFNDIYSKTFIFQKFSDMIISTSEWLQNIFKGRFPIFTVLSDGLESKIGVPTLVKL